MLTFRDLSNAFRKLELERTRPVIAHASLSTFGEIHGGAETLLGALMAACNTLIMPTFTFKTMLTPEIGPADNGITYGSGKDANRMAEFFTPDMPADKLMGQLAETLRQHSKARRSTHPILSFAGINAHDLLAAQTLEEPLAPLRELHARQGAVLLLGVDHSVNTSIHYAERLAGRKQFVRWALTPEGVIQCPAFPGCSNGFQQIAPALDSVTRRTVVGQAVMQLVPLGALVDTVKNWMARDPLALLCEQTDCERCNATRAVKAL